ncbi:MAG: biopolymer transporter ExbD [Candidatus Omnitrophica bacterium]|nr:biopolymer transporter ExbD [Candidatus Omnitrophota bacterium]
MNRRARKQGLVAEINITPFTDVILVLLVIFMITTPLISQLGLKVKLPESKSGKSMEAAARQTQVDITITNEGLIYLEDKLVTRKELKEKISVLHQNYPNLSVVLRSDRLVKFKDIVVVIDTLTELGISNLNIAAIAE